MDAMTATVRVEGEAETKKVGLGALRLVEERPSAAAIMLAHAVKYHRNDIVVQLLASPLMAAPLQFVVGAPDKNVAVRDDARATALDYAISSRNVVAIGLLQKNYTNTWDVWSSVLATHNTSDIKLKDMSPRLRSDLYCALRLAPASFNNHLCAWRSLFGYKRDVLHRVIDIITSGDMARVRYLVSQLNKRENGKPALENTLAFAAKLGQADAISCLLDQDTVLDITAAARLAIVEGQTDCLERLLRAGPSLFPFLSAYAPGTNISARHLCVILDAVHLNDEAALDLLRTRGVRLGPFTGFDDDDEPIDWACRLGHAAAARAILRDPSVVQHIVGRKSDAISRCCDTGHAETLKVLLESVHISHTHSNSTVNIFTDLTPLQLAVCEKDLKTVELVLEQGVDVNECHAGKKSALAIAASFHSYEMCSALLARGASVRASSADGLTAMHYLLRASKDQAAHDTAALVHLFLTERPNDNLQNDILYYLKVYRLYSAVIQKLLSAGAPLNDRTENGLTALHITVYDALTVKDNWDAEILRYNVRTLVLGGADLLAKTTAPATNEDVVLANGAPIPAGLTPMDVARTCGAKSRRDVVVAELTAAIAQRAL
jgi:ankyrin repeat protein